MNIFDIYEDLAGFSEDALVRRAVEGLRNPRKDRLAAVARRMPDSALNAVQYNVAASVTALIRTSGASEAERMAALQVVEKWVKLRGVNDFEI